MRFPTKLNLLLALSLLAAPAGFGQINPANLAVTGYQLISEQRLTRTQSYFTYRADVVNAGPALPAITATLSSPVDTVVVVPGQGNLHFPAVPSRTQITSSNTFTLLIDRSTSFNLSGLRWSFVAPVANAGAGQTAAVGATVHLDASSSSNPTGVGTLTYAWAFQKTPAGSAAQLQNPASVSPTFVPDLLGDYIVVVTVSNGAGTDTAAVTISTTNSGPVADAGPAQTVTAGATVHLDGSRSHDADGDPITYLWTLVQVPPGSQAILSGATTVGPTFVADFAGVYMARLVVNDGSTSSVPAFVTITTSPGHTVPVAVASTSTASIAIGAQAHLDGSGSTDIDGNPLTYKWVLIALPSGSTAVLSNPAIVNPTFIADLPGTYVAQLIVNDGFNDSLPSTVTVSTTGTLPPVAIPGPNQTVAHGATVTLSGTGTDPQGLPLTFKWALIGVPQGSAATLSNVNIAGPTFVADVPGTYVAQLTVNNGVLNSATANVTITTTNTPPVAVAATASNTVPPGSTVTLSASGSSDADHDPLTYRWSLLSRPSGSSATLVAPNTPSPTFVADLEGAYVAQLIVNDGFVDSQPATITITASSGATITLTPDPLNLTNAPGTITVAIGNPAGAGGQAIRLAIVDTTVATAPATVTIPEGQTTTTASIAPAGLGSTSILASAIGFRSGSATITVGSTSLTLSFAANSVGISKTVTGTVTLSSPAPAALSVILSSNNTAVLTVPVSVPIAAGSSTVTFAATGVAAGSASVTAAVSGYGNDTRTLAVATLGAITLQSGLVVGVGQTLPLGITLVTPAPVGGVTVNLTSDDPRLTVSPSVFIPQGATAPSAPAQVTGVNIGAANITASAAGFTGDTKSVQVAANLSFAPSTLTLAVGGSQSLTLTLSGPAPAGGLAVTLTSTNTNAAVVPSGVTIPQNGTTATVQVNAGATAGQATITASSSVSGIVSGTALVTVVTGVAITAPLPAGVVGVPYSFTVTASGGTSPYTFAATGLPAGLSINTATGVITGIPQTAGVSTPSISVTDSSGPPHLTASVTPSVTINPALSITTTSLPNGTVGTAYPATQIVVTGGTAPYSVVAPLLPAGLVISGTGVISGTPTAPGTTNVAVTVTDSTNPTHLTKTANLSIAIQPQALVITTSSLANGTVGTPYPATQIAVTGGTTPYAFVAPLLPAGLLISGTGVISGTPTAPGTTNVAITVTDATSPTHLSTTANLSIAIQPQALVITTSSLPGGTVGTAYPATQIAVTGGTTPYAFVAPLLPAGLVISGTGVISGTPTAPGTTNVAITVTDATSPTHLSTTANLSIAIQPQALVITTSSLPGGTVGTAYPATQIAVTGGTTPYTFMAPGLPAGLVISGTGLISGTPTAPGSFNATITVTDSTNPTHFTKTTSLPLTIQPRPLVITTTSLPDGMVNASYTPFQVNASGGTPGYSFTATGLPGGLSINAAGMISGIPITPGSFTAIVMVTDSTSPIHLTTTANLPITINNVAGGPFLTVAGATIGQNLQTRILIALSPALTVNTNVTITTSNASLVALAGADVDPDAGSLVIQLAAGAASFTVEARALASAGSATVTATAPGYSPGAAQISLSPSAFILSGPNGAGASFTLNQGSSTTLSVSSARLDSSGNFAQTQAIRAGGAFSASVNLSIANPALGSFTVNLPGGSLATIPPVVNFAGGSDTVPIQFTAGTTAVSSTITAVEPSGFGTPAGGANVLPVTVPTVGVIPSNATVGQGLETTANVTVQGVPATDVFITITSSDPAKLLFSPDATSAGAPSISVKLRGGNSTTGAFYVYGVGNSGSVTYTADVPGFGTGIGTVTLGKSAITLSGPGGTGFGFITTTGSPAAFLDVTTALLDASGMPSIPQNVAGGVTATVTVTSANTSVGTITVSPLIISSGNSSASTKFQPLGMGTTLLSAVGSAPFVVPSSGGSLTATVSTPNVGIFADSVGKGLSQQGSISLAAVAPAGGLSVTLTVTSGAASLSANGTDSGSASITVPMPAGSRGGAFFVYGGDSSGSATISATAPGYGGGTTTVNLVPAGVVISGPFGIGFNLSTTVAAGDQPVSVSTVKVDPAAGGFSIQPLKGGAALSVTLNNSDATIGTVPATVSIPGGLDTGMVQFHPLKAGTTFITVVQPAGFTAPPSSLGFSPTSLEADVH